MQIIAVCFNEFGPTPQRALYFNMLWDPSDLSEMATIRSLRLNVQFKMCVSEIYIYDLDTE